MANQRVAPRALGRAKSEEALRADLERFRGLGLELGGSDEKDIYQ
jgi:hypothetical protein